MISFTGKINRKFSPLNFQKTGITSWPSGVDGGLVAASLATASWNRHTAAINSFSKFLRRKNLPLSWPVSVEAIRSYVSWALSEQNMNPNSVSVYLSDLKLAHKLRNQPCNFENDFFISSMIKGAKNLNLYSNIFKPAKFVMTFPLLKILGHEIANSGWSEESKTVVWAACCVAFFGSFRLGEILPGDKTSSHETLTWDRVHFSDSGSAIINIRFPKAIKKPQGDFVDIFKISDCSFCPFSALSRLASISSSNIASNTAVFSFPNGTPLSAKNFVSSVQGLLGKHIGSNALQLSGHSFRAAIPAALANNPSLATDQEIMIWGRWSSDSYKSYTRFKHEAKLAIFKKIVQVFNL
jgi:hypothetical protein